MSDRPVGDDEDSSDREEEWSGWTHPAETGERSEPENSNAEREASGPPERAPLKRPPSERSESIRERLRRQYGLTDRQWYVVETLLLVAPYPIFVLVYIFVPVDETIFLVITLLYSFVAMYVGFLY